MYKGNTVMVLKNCGVGDKTFLGLWKPQCSAVLQSDWMGGSDFLPHSRFRAVRHTVFR